MLISGRVILSYFWRQIVDNVVCMAKPLRLLRDGNSPSFVSVHAALHMYSDADAHLALHSIVHLF